MRRRDRRRPVAARTAAAAVGACLLAALGTAAPAPRAAPTAPALTPALFRTVSSGIAQIRAASCKGGRLTRGTGFLVGRSVAMATRRTLAGACTVQVVVNGRTVAGRSWATLAAKGVSEPATDLVTIKLAASPRGAHVFGMRSSSLAAGASLATVRSAGPKPVLAQGTLTWSGTRAGAPLLGVKAAGAADGAPLLDDAGLVAGIVQLGRGARDAPGSRAGVVEGLDLTRWWGPARADLCRVYAQGGIPSCAAAAPGPSPTPSPTPTPTPDPTPAPGAGPTPEPEPDPEPDPTPGPPRAPTDYVVKGCWVQYTADSWDNVAEAKAFTSIAAGELLAKGPGNFWSVLQLTDGAPADIAGVTASLVSPTGFVSPGTPFTWSQDSELSGGALDWQLTGTGLWFFENTLYPKPQQWTLRWAFPNGQRCDARFTVT